MNVRSLDIKREERWTANRLPYHMALATLSQTALPRSPKRRWRLWHVVALMYLLPSMFALSVIAALALLRHGL